MLKCAYPAVALALLAFSDQFLRALAWTRGRTATHHDAPTWS